MLSKTILLLFFNFYVSRTQLRVSNVSFEINPTLNFIQTLPFLDNSCTRETLLLNSNLATANYFDTVEDLVFQAVSEAKVLSVTSINKTPKKNINYKCFWEAHAKAW